jgi:hypothetical protein
VRHLIQERIFVGLQKAYKISQSKRLKKKELAFNKWKRFLTFNEIVQHQLEMSNEVSFTHHNGSIPHISTNILVPASLGETIFKSKFSKDKSQAIDRSRSLNQPSFYKTNEGFFSAEPQKSRRMQSTTIIFSPSPVKCSKQFFN